MMRPTLLVVVLLLACTVAPRSSTAQEQQWSSSSTVIEFIMPDNDKVFITQPRRGTKSTKSKSNKSTKSMMSKDNKGSKTTRSEKTKTKTISISEGSKSKTSTKGSRTRKESNKSKSIPKTEGSKSKDNPSDDSKSKNDHPSDESITTKTEKDESESTETEDSTSKKESNDEDTESEIDANDSSSETTEDSPSSKTTRSSSSTGEEFTKLERSSRSSDSSTDGMSEDTSTESETNDSRPSIPSIYIEHEVSSIPPDSEDVVPTDSEDVTRKPSTSPAKEPTLAPPTSTTTDNVFNRDNGCLPNVDGLFGNESGVEQLLGFYYQLEVLSLDGEEIKDILSKVETTVSKTLLPPLFVDDCALPARMQMSHQGSYRWRQRRRLVEMTGISTLPLDKVLQGVECTGDMTSEESDCHVADGMLTLYATSAVDEASLDKIRNIIRLAMAEGDFNAIDSRLVNVSYRENIDRDREVDSSTVGSTNETEGSGTKMPTWAIIVLTVVIVGVFASLLLYFASRGLL